MPLPVFPAQGVATGITIETPYTVAQSRTVLVARFAQAETEQRASFADRGFDRWQLDILATDAGKRTLDDFYVARKGATESFLFEPPRDKHRTGVSLGIAGAAQTVFPLPTAGKEAGDYPQDNAAAVLYDDGSPIAQTVQTDARTMTAAVAPANGSVMTADYDRYERVRFAAESGLPWQSVAPNVWRMRLELIEVVS